MSSYLRTCRIGQWSSTTKQNVQAVLTRGRRIRIESQDFSVEERDNPPSSMVAVYGYILTSDSNIALQRLKPLFTAPYLVQVRIRRRTQTLRGTGIANQALGLNAFHNSSNAQLRLNKLAWLPLDRWESERVCLLRKY